MVTNQAEIGSEVALINCGRPGDRHQPPSGSIDGIRFRQIGGQRGKEAEPCPVCS